MDKIGSLNNLRYTDIPIPEPDNNEMLIKVEYCGLNHLDLLIIEGKRLGPKTFPHILGSEFIGIIVKINSKDRNFKIGDRVAVYPWTFCGKCEQCRRGNENICDNGGTFGRTRWGGFAEFVSVPVKNLVKIPSYLSSKLVSASVLSTITAYHMIKRANIKNHATVLVTGATGGVGTSAAQLLKERKCKVICATNHNSKVKKLKELGTDEVVKTNNLINEVKNISSNGVDYVIDIMGGNVWSKGIELLAKNGTMVFCSTTLDDPGSVNLASAFSRQTNILGSYGGTVNDLREVIKLLQKDTIKPVIDSIYPLEKTKEALYKFDQQKAFGKILIKCSI